MAKTAALEQLQKNIRYSFRQAKLLLLALTHSSYRNEAQEAEGHNERLEFLGDAVLQLCVTELLYKAFSEAREGELSFMRAALVGESALASLAREIELDAALRLGRGEEAQGGRARDSLLGDALEALLGAVFLDGGFEAAQSVLTALLAPRLGGLSGRPARKDNKTKLQELSQTLFQDRPRYALLGSAGPDHARYFEVEIALPDGSLYRGGGSSVKKAERAAAAEALAALAAKRAFERKS